MGERHTEGTAGAKNSIHLSQHPIEIVGPSERIDRQRKIDLVGANEGQIGEIAVVKFDLDLVDLCELSGGVDAGDVVVDGNHMSAGKGQAHGVVSESDAKLKDFLALWGGEEFQRIVAGKIGAPSDGVEWELRPTGEGSRWVGRRARGSVVSHGGSLPRATVRPVDRTTLLVPRVERPVASLGPYGFRLTTLPRCPERQRRRDRLPTRASAPHFGIQEGPVGPTRSL